jgi:hypothetical protein
MAPGDPSTLAFAALIAALAACQKVTPAAVPTVDAQPDARSEPSAPAPTAACVGPAQAVERSVPPDLAKLKDWIRSAPADAGFDYGLTENIGAFEKAYVVDLDNDGHDEIVLDEYAGSGGYLHLYVFARRGGGFEYLADAPPWPEGEPVRDGGWYSHDYFDRATGERSVFVRLCGKTYMTFDGGAGGAITLDGYLWQGGKNVRACDPSWARVQLTEHQALFDAKHYDDAAGSLVAFLHQCGPAIAPEVRLSMLVHLARAEARTGDPHLCHSYVDEARSLPGSDRSAARSDLVAAEQECERYPPGASADYRWLLDPRLANSNQIVWDPRFEALLSATVPADGPDGSSASSRSRVRDSLVVPGSVRRSAGRYVSIAGCVPHDCMTRGFLWVDVQTSKSVFASPGACDRIGSRTAGPEDLPPSFWQEHRSWAKGACEERPKTIVFEDGRGPELKHLSISYPR